MTRHPEPKLEVLWQRHVPAGMVDRNDGDDFIDACADVLTEAEQAFNEQILPDKRAFDDGDFVVTISRRPIG